MNGKITWKKYKKINKMEKWQSKYISTNVFYLYDIQPSLLPFYALFSLCIKF